MIDGKALSKPKLREEFSKKAQEHYKVKLFDEEGFSRHTCKICGKNFWSIEKRDTCEDSSHTEYSFFREKPRSIGYIEFWKKFADFFKENGHAEINSYPVVSRWRQDLYFTIASIQDFQRIENGMMSFEYNNNPLIVPQMCLRFGDIENVGVTGRHFTSFMMAGQHAFNYPKEGYWKDRTIELNYNFLTKVLGVKKNDLVYNEDVWAMPDFSEFGPSLETFAGGSELVNSVFTQFECVNGKVSELAGKVVDVGWGFERLLWFYTGHEDAYDAVFSDTIKRLKPKLGVELDTALFKKFARIAGELDVDEVKNARQKEMHLLKSAGITLEDYEKRIRPSQALYAVLDHTRTLLFGISYGSLPSNIGGGYNLRIILRRAIDFIEKYNLGITMQDIAALQAKELNALYPELQECVDGGEFAEVIDIEAKRYSKSRENSGKVVDAIIEKGEKLDEKRLRTLYESNGVTPAFIKSVASERNVKIEMPDNIYEGIIVGDLVKKEKQKGPEIEMPATIPETKQLYYDFESSSKSKVLMAKDRYLILDKTPFYPEGGGQAADQGTISGVNVTDVQKYNGVIVHTLEKPVSQVKGLSEGSTVEAQVNLGIRHRLIAHHTATHLISAAARKIIGKHAWQEGAKKEPDKAHIDVAHFERFSEKQLNAIEDQVNQWLRTGIKVNVNLMDRGNAESKYGFEIYQGHGVPSKKMRIVLIESKDGKFIDAEACGGLHAVNLESAVALIKIISSYRLHDGINRIEFVAGEAALDRFRAVSSTLSQAAQKLNSDQFKILDRIAFTEEDNKKMRKQLQEFREAMADQAAKTLSESDKVEKEIDVPREMLRIIATKIIVLNSNAMVLLKNRDGEAVCVAGEKSGGDALKFLKEHSKGKKFVGGGSAKFAEGKIV